MDSFEELSWFAIHAKRFREAVAASSLGALGLESFLPMVRIADPARAVIKSPSKPLFPGYFFARFNPSQSLDMVEGARGVMHVIKSGSCPIPVDDQVIQEIQERVDSDGLIELQLRPFKPGDRVSIEEGCFAGMVGRIESELDDGKRVAILLEALWNARVVLERQKVEAA